MEIMIAMFSVLVSALTERAKKKFPKLSSRVVVAIFVIAGSLVYGGFKFFVPEELQMSILQFAGIVYGGSQLIYNFVIRIVQGDVPKMSL